MKWSCLTWRIDVTEISVTSVTGDECRRVNYGDTEKHFETCKPTSFISSFRTLMRDSLICELERESRDDKNKILTGGFNGFTSHDYALHRDRVTQGTFYQT